MTATAPQRHDTAPRRPPAGAVPPHDLDAEAAVLAAVLLDPAAIGQLDGAIDAEQFYSAANRAIFAACRAVADAGVPVDVVAVKGWLRDRGQLATCGGAGYLGSLLDGTPNPGNVLAHARTVHEKARLRQTIAACQRIAAEGYGDTGDARQWLQAAARDVGAIADADGAAEAVTAHASAGAVLAQVEATIARAGALSGLSTGIGALDQITAGMHPADMIVLSAVTGGGKTALAGQIATTVAAQGRGVVFFSLEMPHEQLITRMICSDARVSWHAIRLGQPQPGDHGKLLAAAERIGRLPIVVDRDRGMRVRDLLGRARRSAARFERDGTPLGLVVVDYVQLLDGRDEVGPRDTRERELSRCARLLVQLAEALGVPVLVLTQLNDAGEIRDSRAIGFEATSWWDLKIGKATDGPLPVTIKIRKQRHAPHPAECSCWFHGSYLLFSDSDFARAPARATKQVAERDWTERQEDDGW